MKQTDINTIMKIKRVIGRLPFVWTLLLASVFLTNSCTDGFEEINTRHDRLTSVEPEYLFGLTTVHTLRELSNNNNWYFFGNYSNQLSVIGGGGPHFSKDGRSERIWNNSYVNSLNSLYQIINDYGDNPAYANRVAIAKIWRAYVFSQLVGLYGPLPYLNACNGEPYIEYDSEPVIYRGIWKELKEAYEAMDAKGDKYPAEAEPFLASNIDRWKQFAHCIRLRVAMRLSDLPAKTPAELVRGLQDEARAIVVEELNNAEQGLLINDNKGNFFMKFSLSPEESQNPLFREVRNAPITEKTGGGGNLPVIHESLVMWMYPYHDPCWENYVKEGESVSARRLPVNMGRPHSFESPPNFGVLNISSPYGNFLNYDDFARIADAFTAMEAEFPFFTHAELVFSKAEAKLKGIWNGPKTAEEYYYEGIDSRCARFGRTGSTVTDYKNFPGIKWSTPSDTVTDRKTGVSRAEFMDWQQLIDSYLGGEEDNYKRIVAQHWLSLFIQGWDSYTLLRRTGVLKFKPHFGANVTSGYLNTESGSTWAYTPQRLCYPWAEDNINLTETKRSIRELLFDNKLQDPEDQVTFRLIFTKDAPIVDTSVSGNGQTIQFRLINLARNF
ncbi:MAG: SusD/RagB family nutrient-binding outer membrane lipoprotein [Candidatus Symbiothrix sp.]|jgi:hypothetical protein|nr:SusD/RagB family nutrient-binding outer membrane lipoprotein [Candidatus Symbiothrix sp.]